MTSGSRRELAAAARAWPFEEARKILGRIERRQRAGRPLERILFETGCGPSGLPHIGTFGDVVLPTLGAEPSATYRPFLPLCPRSGRVLQVSIVAWDAAAGSVVYEENGVRTEVPVTGGHCKLQWKADWAMRWLALGVDYEMS